MAFSENFQCLPKGWLPFRRLLERAAKGETKKDPIKKKSTPTGDNWFARHFRELSLMDGSAPSRSWADYSDSDEEEAPRFFPQTRAPEIPVASMAESMDLVVPAGAADSWTSVNHTRKRSAPRGSKGPPSSSSAKFPRTNRGGGGGGGARGGRGGARGGGGGRGGNMHPRPASIYSMPYTETTSTYRQVPMELEFFKLDAGYLAEITTGAHKQRLDDLKNQISTAAPWPSEWRRAIESLWTLGRINQACGLRSASSRAFYKLVEISHLFSLIPPVFKVPVPTLGAPVVPGLLATPEPAAPLRLLHAGEAPGGFVDAAIWLSHGSLDDRSAVAGTDPRLECWGISQAGEPSWAPCYLDKPQILTLDLLEPEQMAPFVEGHRGYFDGVTCDGGFEVPPELRTSQEEQMFALVEAEVELALATLKLQGWFVLKIFAVDTEATRLLVLRLWKAFGQVYLVSPAASKPSNDERFVVAQYYLAPEARRTLSEAEVARWMDWFVVYAAEDKMRQYEPVQRALQICAQLQVNPDIRLPLEPGLTQAKEFCTRYGLPLKAVPFAARAHHP